MLVYEQVLFNLYHTLELLVGGTVVVLSGSFSRFEEHVTGPLEPRGPWGLQPLFFVRIKKKSFKMLCSIPPPQLISNLPTALMRR